MKAIASAVADFSQEQILTIERDGELTFELEGQSVTILRDDVEIFSEDIPGWLVANEGTLTIALDITLTEELRQEGMARELVNRIQNLRKQSGFEVSDRIRILIEPQPALSAVLQVYGATIAKEVQAVSIEEQTGFTPTQQLEIDDQVFSVFIEKAN